MKKFFSLQYLFLFFISTTIFAQTPPFDTVPIFGPPVDSAGTPARFFDRFGNYYTAEQLQKREIAETITHQDSVCIAGHFELTFFNPGASIAFYDSDSGQIRRDLVCAVFRDLSQLITPVGNPVVRINIRGQQVPGGGVAFATPIFSEFNIPNNTLGGFIDDAVWKTINTGVDSWQGFSPRPDFHGLMEVNLGYNYNVSSTASCTTCDLDLYTVVLHEALHLLGFASFTNLNTPINFGSRHSGQALGYYTRYDSYLKFQNTGDSIIANTGTCYNTVIDNNGMLLNYPNACSIIFRGTNTVNDILPVQTGGAFGFGFSMSHIDSSCYNTPRPPFVMHTGGIRYIQTRTPDDPEVRILCDLGYNITGTYGDGTGPVRNYTACNPNTIAGVNDITATATVGQPLTINFGPINNNDVNSNEVSCLEVIGGAVVGTLSATTMAPGGSVIFTPTLAALDTAYIRYIPKNTTFPNLLGNITYIVVPVNSGIPPASCDNLNICSRDTNLVINPGFELGNTGFFSQYITPHTPTPNHYGITSNANFLHPAWRGLPHSGNNLMAVDGSDNDSVSPPPVVWQQTISISANTDYIFSCWLDNPIDTSMIGMEDPTIILRINNEDVGIISIPELPDTWVQACAMWRSDTNTTARITLYFSPSKNGGGRDVLIDDLEFYRRTTTPPPIVNTPFPLCSGNCVTLTAVGSGNILWNTGAAANAINVCPATTTTYTVTRTSGGCTSPPASVTVVVNTPTVVNAGPDRTFQLCGATDSVSIGGIPPSGGARPYTFSWSPAVGLSCTDCLTPNASPANTTTYILSITDSLGCVGSDTVVATVTPCCTTPPNGIDAINMNASTLISTLNFGSSTYPAGLNAGRPLYITGTLTIDQDLTFFGAQIRLAPKARIVIQPGRTLRVNSSTLDTACREMWNGVYITGNTARLFINFSNVRNGENPVVSINGGFYRVNGSFFDRNYKHMIVNPYAGKHTGEVLNTQFRCTPSGSNIFTLIAPHAGQRTAVGIEINRVDDPADYLPSITITSGNIFDNADVGIKAVDSDVRIASNQFYNITKHNFTVPPCDPVTGICPPAPEDGSAILALDTDLFNDPGLLIVFCPIPFPYPGINTITVTGNTFINCYRGAEISNYFRNTVTNNTLLNSTVSTNPFAATSDHAVFIKNFKSDTITVTGNSITNFRNGIHLLRNNFERIVYKIFINDNTITSLAQGQMTGIFVEDINNTNTNNIGTCNLVYQVNRNRITNADNGIWMRSLSSNPAFSQSELFTGRFNVESNTILMNAAQTSGPSPGQRNGIKLERTTLGAISLNSITGNVSTSSSSSENYRGIYAILSPSTDINCNTVTITGQSIVCEGPMLNTRVRANSMNIARDGFVLRNNALIGSQGSAGSPSDNKWVGGSATFFRSQTFTFNTDSANILSPLWVRTGLETNPTKNLSNVNDKYIPIITTGQQVLCPVASDPGGGGSDISAIANDEVSFPVNEHASRWISKLQLYELLRHDSSLMQGSLTLQNFYDSASVSCIGKVCCIRHMLSEGKTDSAAMINNSIVPACHVEYNYKTFHDIYFISNMGRNITQQQREQLFTIASQCPLTGSDVVYQARTLLNLITNSSIIFTDGCESQSAKTEVKNQEHIRKMMTRKDIKLYPNPNNGNMQLDYSLDKNETGKLIITDIAGKAISEYTLQYGRKTLSVSEGALQNGIYFYRISINGQIIHKDKLVIIR